MTSIVLELQKEALDTNVELPDLLRKAKFVARKLKINEIEDWINLELDGYYGNETPRYRHIQGVPIVNDPIRGDIHFVIENQAIYDSFARRNMNNSISELEVLYNHNQKDSPIILPIYPGVMKHFRETFKTNHVPEKLYVTSAVLKNILDSVRNLILEWSLKLEDDGIQGENLTFSPEEEKIAHERTNIYNTLIYGAQGSPIQVGQGNTQNINIYIEDSKELINSIKDSIDKLELSNVAERDLKIEINNIEIQLESPEPNPKIITEGFKSIRTILEGFGSALLVQILIFAISKHIGM
jgi:hypothetical protein